MYIDRRARPTPPNQFATRHSRAAPSNYPAGKQLRDTRDIDERPKFRTTSTETAPTHPRGSRRLILFRHDASLRHTRSRPSAASSRDAITMVHRRLNLSTFRRPTSSLPTGRGATPPSPLLYTGFGRPERALPDAHQPASRLRASTSLATAVRKKGGASSAQSRGSSSSMRTA